MRSLCDKDKCTACGAFAKICVLRMQFIGKIRTTVHGTWKLMKDVRELWPMLQCIVRIIGGTDLNRPLQAYAAWSLNEKMHSTAASGGIASELYSYAEGTKNAFCRRAYE